MRGRPYLLKWGVSIFGESRSGPLPLSDIRRQPGHPNPRSFVRSEMRAPNLWTYDPQLGRFPISAKKYGVAWRGVYGVAWVPMAMAYPHRALNPGWGCLLTSVLSLKSFPAQNHLVNGGCYGRA